MDNRTLYREVAAVGAGTGRPLEEYLRALWRLGRARRTRDSLSGAELVALLGKAAVADAPPFDDAWRGADLDVTEEMGWFETWERVLLSQVADLRELAEGPPPAHPALGVDAPRPAGSGPRATGCRWYNHDVRGYLECAIAGMYGGWDVADGVRVAVPGPAVSMYPEPRDAFDVGRVDWGDFAQLLVYGQEYE